METDTDFEIKMIDPDTGGMKGKKPIDFHAIPWEAMKEIGRIYAFGAKKYEDYNFRKGYAWSLSYDALQRHLWAWWNGEDYDGESGMNHLGHAAWHAINLLFFQIVRRGKDDRPHVYDATRE